MKPFADRNFGAKKIIQVVQWIVDVVFRDMSKVPVFEFSFLHCYAKVVFIFFLLKFLALYFSTFLGGGVVLANNVYICIDNLFLLSL